MMKEVENKEIKQSFKFKLQKISNHFSVDEMQKLWLGVMDNSGSRPTQAKVSKRPYLRNKLRAKGLGAWLKW
jgi:hypothetical protein